MGAAFSRGELELTMEGEEHESSSAISVRVEAVKHDEQPGGIIPSYRTAELTTAQSS